MRPTWRYFTVASTWYDFLGDNKAVLSDYMWHADEAETSANKYGEVCEQLLHLLREVT